MALWYLGENHTADNVLIADSPDGPKIALIERKGEPFKGCYAFPGGFVDTAAKRGETYKLDIETPDQAALRELAEEVSVQISPSTLLSFQEIGFYNDPGRDPRSTAEAWVATTAFLIHVPEPLPMVASDDAARAEWILLSDVLNGKVTLAFDHAQILSDAMPIFEASSTASA